MPAEPVKRGCGTRVKGGVYAECGLSDHGLPIEYFFFDPPVLLTQEMMDKWGLSPRGVRLFTDENGTSHIVDWVGAEHYPNVADFIEEVRRFGMSRRCEGIDYSKLDASSRIILVHPRAIVDDPSPYYRNWLRVNGYNPCPKEDPIHMAWITVPDATGMCCGIWWNDVEGGEPRQDPPLPFSGDPRYIIRKMPSFEYPAAARPAGLDPVYRAGLFASLPITNFSIVRGEGADKKKEKVTPKDIPVNEVDE